MPPLENEFNKAKDDGKIPDIVTFTTAIQSGNFPEQEKIITLYKKLLEKITANFESDERTSLDDNSDAVERIKKGEFATGGCCIDEDSPKWQCRDCSNEFGKVELL